MLHFINNWRYRISDNGYCERPKQSNDEAKTLCTGSHVLQQRNNTDECRHPLLRQRAKTRNLEANYLGQRTKTMRRNQHCHKSQLHPVGRQHLAQESVSSSNRIPAEYIHLGQCTGVCRHCGAMFWECEKVTSASHSSQSGYNKCCYDGRIILRPPPEYP
ncbi:hypothetical protein Tco_0501989 [Tanacetum coccineum]